MSQFSYSPWGDAAAYGQGLGNTLSQALLQQPQRRMEMQQQKERFPLEQDLLRARIQEALAQPAIKEMLLKLSQERADTGRMTAESMGKYRGAMGDAATTNAGTRKNALAEKEKTDQASILQKDKAAKLAEWLAQTKQAVGQADIGLKQAQTQKIEKGPSESNPQADAQIKRAIEVQKLLGSTLPGGTNTVPSINAAEWMAQQQNANPGTPMERLAKSIMSPNLQTNKTWMGFGPDQVVTNGAKFQAPNMPMPVHAQPMGNAPAPWTPPQPVQTGEAQPTIVRNPKTGQRLQLINGQWTPIQ